MSIFLSEGILFEMNVYTVSSSKGICKLCYYLQWIWASQYFHKIFLISVVSVANRTKKNLIFKSNPKHQTLEIKSATLWTYISRAAATKPVETEPDHGKTELQLYKSYKPSGNISREKGHFYSVHFKTAGWYTVDITGIVKEWFSVWPKLDLSLDIAVEGTKSLEIGGVSGDGESLQPFLAVETEEKQNVKERKRRADSQSCSLTGPCCRHDLVVNLSDWDFVISPRKVNIYRCAGICKLPATSLYKHRSRVSTLREHNAVQHNPDLERSGCCRENRIDPLQVLMFDLEEQVQLKRLENVKVRSCHCVV